MNLNGQLLSWGTQSHPVSFYFKLHSCLLGKRQHGIRTALASPHCPDVQSCTRVPFGELLRMPGVDGALLSWIRVSRDLLPRDLLLRDLLFPIWVDGLFHSMARGVVLPGKTRIKQPPQSTCWDKVTLGYENFCRWKYCTSFRLFIPTRKQSGFSRELQSEKVITEPKNR